MKKYNLKIGLPITTVLVSLITSSYTAKNKYRFEETGYFAQTINGSQTLIVGQTLPKGWNAETGQSLEDLITDCEGTNATCFVQAEVIMGKEIVSEVYNGEFIGE